MLPDRQMATTWNAHFPSEMDACEGHENQSQALIQHAPSEIPTGVLFPQLMALSLGPQHYSRPCSSPSPDLKNKTFERAARSPLPPRRRKAHRARPTHVHVGRAHRRRPRSQATSRTLPPNSASARQIREVQFDGAAGHVAPRAHAHAKMQHARAVVAPQPAARRLRRRARARLRARRRFRRRRRLRRIRDEGRRTRRTPVDSRPSSLCQSQDPRERGKRPVSRARRRARRQRAQAKEPRATTRGARRRARRREGPRGVGADET